jgi:hypothetical protein
MMVKVFAVAYALVMALLIVVQVWLCVISLPYILVALFTVPWGIFFAVGLLASAFERSAIR